MIEPTAKMSLAGDSFWSDWVCSGERNSRRLNGAVLEPTAGTGTPMRARP